MTPEQEEQVRRLLGSLPPEGPLPPAVAARLDDTLAGLVAERPMVGPVVAERGETRPDELAARRGRRWRTGLVAAAAVVVVGLGLTTVVDDLTGSGGDAATESAADSSQTLAGSEAAPEAAGSGAPGLPQGVTLLTTSRQELGSGTLAHDVQALVAAAPEKGSAREGLTAESAGPDAAPDSAPDTAGQGLAAIGPCVVPSTAPGEAIAPVQLDGGAATLVLSPAGGGTRVARVYSCDDGDTVLARTIVPAR